MGNLFLLFAIVSRPATKKLLNFFKEEGISCQLATVGRGTATSDVLDYFGLESSEKIIIMCVVSAETWKKTKAGLRSRMNIEYPGTGIAFIVPLSSVGGGRTLAFLTDGQNFELKEESSLKDTKYELLVVIASQGYSEMVMDAAHQAGAGGGTVIHAKGTGLERAEQFLGVSIASEKEMLFVVCKAENKNAIMQSIMANAGLNTKARCVVFSLPVTDTAGMRLSEALEEDKRKEE